MDECMPMFGGADMARLKKHQFNNLRFAMSDSEVRREYTGKGLLRSFPGYLT